MTVKTKYRLFDFASNWFLIVCGFSVAKEMWVAAIAGMLAGSCCRNLANEYMSALVIAEFLSGKNDEC